MRRKEEKNTMLNDLSVSLFSFSLDSLDFFFFKKKKKSETQRIGETECLMHADFSLNIKQSNQKAKAKQSRTRRSTGSWDISNDNDSLFTATDISPRK
jgi:uncharacterized LabA/DUF88 family protein